AFTRTDGRWCRATCGWVSSPGGPRPRRAEPGAAVRRGRDRVRAATPRMTPRRSPRRPRPLPHERPIAPPRGRPCRDLLRDESMGGHTLSRHVGWTDAELRERLRVEPQISVASSYTDCATAERVVGAAIAEAGRSLEAWAARPLLTAAPVDRADERLARVLRGACRSGGVLPAAPCR